MHPCPLTDRSRRAALWASAPAYREEKKERSSERNSGGMVGGREGRKEINACRHLNRRRFLVARANRFHCSENCFIS